MNLKEIQNIYFVGIGGIGMSALARYFNQEGRQIFGYDKVETILTKKLVKEGMEIHYVDDVSKIPDQIDMVIYTPAIPVEHKELTWFRDHEFSIFKRSEVLGLISKEKKAIAIAGTHGKTSSCSLTADILKKCGVEVSAFIGGIMKEYDTNFMYGDSDYVVVEADEYDRSFLRLYPEIAAVQAMDPDHLDIYGDHGHMLQAFKSFTQQINEGGRFWLNHDLMSYIDDEWKMSLDHNGIRIRTFGIEEGDLQAKNIEVINGLFEFDLVWDDKHQGRFVLPMAGRHNVRNALAGIGIALDLGLEPKNIRNALESFKGIKRRFEFVYRSGDLVIIDDYAHHPEELIAAIQAARELYPGKKITGIFQPHLFSRTKDFATGFGQALSGLDQVYLTEIYPARELPMEGVTSQIILDNVSIDRKKIIRKSDIPEIINAKEHEVILILGAGDIDVQIPKLIENINE